MTALKRFFASSTRLFWALQCIGWAGYFALNFLAAIGYGKPPSYYRVILASTLLGFATSTLLRLGYRAIWGLQTWRLIGAAALLLTIATAIYARLYAEVVFSWCLDCRPSSLLGYLGYFGTAFYVFLSWSGLYFGIKFSREIAHERETALRANAMAHEAQLKMLRYQLNPHFLFNTLNAISTLVLDNQNATANRMVSGLSAFLRHSLDSDPMQRVTLNDELEAVTRYLGIEQLRFGERLNVKVEASTEARTALVPSLILQPLIENSIKYAISRRIEGGTIAIRARIDNAMLEIHIEDDGPGLPEGPACNGHGVGLVNTRERLRVLYGSNQSFDVRNRATGGVEAVLRLPFDPTSQTKS
ncbi:sensor histidine kinase [Tahibacter amnicola]|uniref:Histidine kinase n=1 Tax=Tahibacter amnicola TaxID=2976241 RepID=A0ABY6BG31_9GAMM|nr:histidine kinase [Tahibacter amnicola]UXI68248.1 histidine kinase [Tahibacter amnicola]